MGAGGYDNSGDPSCDLFQICLQWPRASDGFADATVARATGHDRGSSGRRLWASAPALAAAAALILSVAMPQAPNPAAGLNELARLDAALGALDELEIHGSLLSPGVLLLIENDDPSRIPDELLVSLLY